MDAIELAQLKHALGVIEEFFVGAVGDTYGHLVLMQCDPELGTVKWFDDSKGYGFIRDVGKREVFVHQKDIEVDGFRTLRPGQKVTFRRRQTNRSVQAIEVEPVDPET